MTDAARTVLIAPDSYKGSLTSVEVAWALGAGWSKARPADTLLLSPLADGGEGTLVAIEAAGGWEPRQAVVASPDMTRVTARWLAGTDGRAFLELASASGLSLVNPGEHSPLTATTFGTGEVIRAVLDAGFRRLTIGIGGSATTDGGAGILQALGAVLVDEAGAPLVEPPTPARAVLIGEAERVELADLDPRLAEVDLDVACDVTNPLLGRNGAAATYGPQKGATPEDVAFLDGNLGRYATKLAEATSRDERDTPGAGAAGGVGFALLSIQDCFRSFALRPGVDLVMDLTDFDGKLSRADLVITGEGQIDAQTAFGKTALGVARRASAAAVPCVAVGGGVEVEGIEALAEFGVTVVPVVERPQTVEEAMTAGTAPLERCGERIARLVSVW